ncbi:GtrA family protein [Ancylomarina euxinus]|uniref:GtrA family protein n=1 Tax=Ancylomarina euxinus TaxID=2283627 RepID=A0A425Y1Q0_9BACT|nr:GtrA family protein [Ancylomarina euxinus]MCZ4695080.1 GtrA family protein [Ancylomarina euxinus]MUP14984.1 GtrA family protein [Ancylomarina euxinus]RRG21874.1 GtrA family protein [Ancylomarina euxinus]
MKLFYAIIRLIEKIILWFYPPFRKFMPEQTFKYAATGGANTALDIFLFFLFYNFVLNKELVDFGFIVISPHIAAFIMSFIITFPIGFILAKYISFPGSYLRKRIQLLRYGLSVMGSLVLNYIFLKLFVESFGWYPTPSKMVTTLIVILFSYTVQKYFTFKIEIKD